MEDLPDHVGSPRRGSALETSIPGDEAAEMHGIELLTSREREILRLIADCFGNREIAETLSIEEKTVKSHINNVYSKLQIKSGNGGDKLCAVALYLKDGVVIVEIYCTLFFYCGTDNIYHANENGDEND